MDEWNVEPLSSSYTSSVLKINYLIILNIKIYLYLDKTESLILKLCG
jgi:hypothetical protein